MENPAWILFPWALFALAAATKVWQIFAHLRRQRSRKLSSIDQMRERLERIWSRDSLSQR